MYHRYIFRNQQVFAHAQNKSEGCISVSIYAIPWVFFLNLVLKPSRELVHQLRAKNTMMDGAQPASQALGV